MLGTRRPLAPEAVHDHADGVEERHVDRGSDAKDDPDLGDIESDVVAAQREQDLTRATQQGQGHHHAARGDEGAPMLDDGAAHASVDADVRLERRGDPRVGHEGDHKCDGGGAGHRLEDEGGAKPPLQTDEAAQHRTHEEADAMGPADQGERPSPAS